MATKLKILLVLLILSSSSFSQTVTDKICFSHDKARAIAIDLTRGDSAITELKVINKMVWQLNEKIDAKDSTISIYVSKEKNYIKQVADYEKIVTVQDTVIKGLEKDVKDLTRKNTNLKKGIKWLGGGFVSSILILLTFTIIK
jgi:flagellar biosynthesis regulator FlaF